MAESLVVYGRVGRPHGLQGELRFFPYNPESPVLHKIKAGRLVLGQQTLDVQIVRVRGSEESFILRTREITTKEAAAAWTNAELFIDPAIFPPIDEEDTWYVWQLEGLEARDAQGEVVGKVVTLHNYGAGDVLIINTPRGVIDVPFQDPWVGEINIEGKFVIVDPNWLGEDEP